ncbi:MAG: hypothetical protein KC478_14130 [Bacteriovoracaceae bacterium]|nr:hypothetical protein [Bacteriovoracaceae bacterium]
MNKSIIEAAFALQSKQWSWIEYTEIKTAPINGTLIQLELPFFFAPHFLEKAQIASHKYKETLIPYLEVINASDAHPKKLKALHSLQAYNRYHYGSDPKVSAFNFQEFISITNLGHQGQQRRYLKSLDVFLDIKELNDTDIKRFDSIWSNDLADIWKKDDVIFVKRDEHIFTFPMAFEDYALDIYQKFLRANTSTITVTPTSELHRKLLKKIMGDHVEFTP